MAAMDDDYSGLAKRTGWCKKQTSADKKKNLTWKQAALVKRYFISDGYRVDYYDKAPVKDHNKSKDGAKAKSRGVFDLREVESLSTPTDETAPAWCVMVQVEKHRFVLDFGYKGERNAWLRIWCNAVPMHAISKEWQTEFMEEAMKREIATRGPFGQIGSRGSIFGRRLSRSLSGLGRSSSSLGKSSKALPEAAREAAVAAAAQPGSPAAAPGAPKSAAEAEAEAKQAAAVKVQALLRGKKARAEVGKKRKAALVSAQAAVVEAAGVKRLDQAATAAEVEAKRLEEAAETGDAATKMQAALRGKQARKQAAAARAAADQQGSKAKAASATATADAAALLATEEAVDEVKAAVARGLKLQAEAEAVKREAAAIKMQATIRGRNARNKVSKKRQESADAKAAADAAKSNTASLAEASLAAADELAEAEEAATKMQSGIRSRAARKKVEDARKKKAKAEAATEKARGEQAQKEALAAQKAAEAKAAEAEVVAATKHQDAAGREAESMIQRQLEQSAAATTLQSGVRGRSSRKSLKEQMAATKLAAAQAAEAEGHTAVAARQVAAAHAELKKRGSSVVLEESLAEAEENQAQLAAVGSAKACIVTAERARLDAMKAAEGPDGAAPLDKLVAKLMVTVCKCFAPPPPMDPVQAAEEADLINSQGLQFNARGDSRAALRCFQKAVSLCPLQSRYLLSAGNMHVKLREAQAARCIYEWLLTLPLDNKEASVAQSKLEEAIAMQIE